MVYIKPCTVQGCFGVIRCSCLKMSCNSKVTGHRAKRTEIWESDILVLWAHGLHLLFSPVCPLYSGIVILIGYPRFPKTACILRPQPINIQRVPEIALFRFA